jgi:MinD-like ATPase involved in chromosome partitioning or flagellar assembly
MTRVFAGASGKGGAGKTTIVANLVSALTKLQKTRWLWMLTAAWETSIFSSAPSLDIEIYPLGWIPHDTYVQKAVRQQRAVVELSLNAQASRAFLHVAMAICALPPIILPSGQIQLFWQRLFY